MKTNIRKPWMRAGAWIGLGLLCLSVTGETCTEDRDIEVTVGAEIMARYEARGIINTFDGTHTVNVVSDADLARILEDNGFEDQVVAYIEGAMVRVVQRDNGAPGRTVEGTVTVQLGAGGGPESNLIVQQTATINDPALANWVPVPLEPAGLNLINQALTSYLVQVANGNPNPVEPVLTFHSYGNSSPQGVSSSFDWEVKVIMTLVGTKTVTIIDPI